MAQILMGADPAAYLTEPYEHVKAAYMERKA